MGAKSVVKGSSNLPDSDSAGLFKYPTRNGTRINENMIRLPWCYMHSCEGKKKPKAQNSPKLQLTIRAKGRAVRGEGHALWKGEWQSSSAGGVAPVTGSASTSAVAWPGSKGRCPCTQRDHQRMPDNLVCMNWVPRQKAKEVGCCLQHRLDPVCLVCSLAYATSDLGASAVSSSNGSDSSWPIAGCWDNNTLT